MKLLTLDLLRFFNYLNEIIYHQITKNCKGLDPANKRNASSFSIQCWKLKLKFGKLP